MNQVTRGATNLQVCRSCLGVMSYGAKKLTEPAISRISQMVEGKRNLALRLARDLCIAAYCPLSAPLSPRKRCSHLFGEVEEERNDDS
jgi:hypothetical protein